MCLDESMSINARNGYSQNPKSHHSSSSLRQRKDCPHRNVVSRHSSVRLRGNFRHSVVTLTGAIATRDMEDKKDAGDESNNNESSKMPDKADAQYLSHS
jgi:hypothetical protein